ncbi:hypothetical protein FRC08_018442 [Ceratobasidium sp. 394]|nr:hypothetical protein FRC08_018442 [Ceratobasidium sp. 394]KAG9097976.1 hypothetical protein FS749_004983 [Ceratobasidium sp. UAMH 11750]
MYELLKPPVDLELAFAHCARIETSPRRTEANWNLLWDMKFQREIARIRLPNFTYTNQLPLVLRDAVSAPSTDPKTADTNTNDGDISDDTGSENEDEDEELFDVEDSPTKPKPRRMEHGDRAYYGKNPAPTERLAFALRSQVSPVNPTGLDLALVPAPLTPINPKSRPVDPPNTDQSIPARRGKDQFFYVDYALISLAPDLEDGKPRKTLMGFKDIPAATGHAPTLVELKRCISRTQQPGDREMILGRKIADGFDDIQKESRAAFACYPSQKSFVGLSVTGPWWSFCLMRRSAPTQILHSRVFVLSNESHEKLLSIIIDAAAKSPADPLAYDNRILERYFERFRGSWPYSAGRGCFAPSEIDLTP